jgi:hypothetical protein
VVNMAEAHSRRAGSLTSRYLSFGRPAVPRIRGPAAKVIVAMVCQYLVHTSGNAT